MVIPRRFRFYFVFCVVVVLSTFGLSSTCYDMMLFVDLLWCFIRMRVIQIGNVDLISRIYQLMVVDMLKNWSCRYSSHYFIKFIAFMRFIMLLTWILFHHIWFFVICILDLSIYNKFESIILFFFKKKVANF